MKKFEENIAYLERNIPPDDIYIFAEETFMAALYFLYRWSKLEDINQVYKEDIIARKWVQNVIGFQKVREKHLEVQLDLGIEVMEE